MQEDLNNIEGFVEINDTKGCLKKILKEGTSDETPIKGSSVKGK